VRSVFLLQIETRASLAIIAIVVVIFLITIFKSVDNFNKFVDRFNINEDKHEEIRLQENP